MQKFLVEDQSCIYVRNGATVKYAELPSIGIGENKINYFVLIHPFNYFLYSNIFIQISTKNKEVPSAKFKPFLELSSLFWCWNWDITVKIMVVDALTPCVAAII